MITTALILAAGEGLRMRPLTQTIPKPLVRLGRFALIEHQLRALVRAGITDVIINVSYLAEKIIEALGDGQRYGCTIRYSLEPNGPLGTGGGVVKALSLMDGGPFLLVNSDVVTAFDYRSLTLPGENLAHLVMVPNPAYHREGDFSIDENGLLQRSGYCLTYAGIARIHPQLFKGVEPLTFSLSDVLISAIDAGQVTGECFNGVWYNIGTAYQLHLAEQALCADIHGLLGIG